MNNTSPVFLTRSGFNTTPARRLFSGLAVKSAAAVSNICEKIFEFFLKQRVLPIGALNGELL
jgi:hypothetical protein